MAEQWFHRLLKVFGKIHSLLSQSPLLPHPKTTLRTILSLLSHCDLSIERVSLGTSMADSNRRQDGSHVGEKQE